MRRDEMRLY